MAISDGGWILQAGGGQLSAGTYSEYKETGQERYIPEAGDAVRVFDVLWEQRLDFLADVLGYSTLGGGTGIKRILPEQHPDLNLTFASEASVVGMGQPLLSGGLAGGKVQWSIARCTVTYRYFDYEILSDSDVADASTPTNPAELNRYVTRLYSFSAEYLTLQNNSFTFVTSGGVLPTTPGKIVCAMEKQLTWHDVPGTGLSVPTENQILELLGTVNSALFEGYPAGSCLFMGVDPHRQRPTLPFINGSVNQGVMWSITYKFLIRNNGSAVAGDPSDAVAGHNYVYNSTGATAFWDLVTSGTFKGTVNGVRIYGNGDHNLLFQL